MAEIKVVSFRVGDEVYAVDIMKIDSISEMMKTMKLPGLPVFMIGVANLRGEVIPVIDTRVKFMLEGKKDHYRIELSWSLWRIKRSVLWWMR